MKQAKKETEADKDKKAYENMIKMFQAKGLVLIKGIWQKPNKNEKHKS